MLLPLASARSLIYLEHGVLERLSLARQQSQGQGRHFLHRREGALLEKSGRRGQRKIGMSKQATPRDKCWTKGAIDIAATIANFMALADPLGGSHAHFCCSSSSEDFGCAKKTDRKSMRLWLIQELIFCVDKMPRCCARKCDIYWFQFNTYLNSLRLITACVEASKRTSRGGTSK